MMQNQAQRPWLSLYRGVRPELEPGCETALDMFRKTLARSPAAPLVHYLFGVAMGAIYGAYAERRQADASGAGFGTTVWVAADEIAMPLLGLSDSPSQRPLEMHLQALIAHLVYGIATEFTRRPVQAHFDRATSNAA